MQGGLSVYIGYLTAIHLRDAVPGTSPALSSSAIPSGRSFWALVDSALHGLAALLVTAPIIHSTSTAEQMIVLLGPAFLAGTLVDVDHFLAARSRSFWTATHLAKRPPTHSVTFALLLGTAGYLLSGSLSTAWVVFVALTSHVLRDASVGTAPLLWPLGDWRIPRWAYCVGEVGLVMASSWVSGCHR
jgi:hypothetical protein